VRSDSTTTVGLDVHKRTIAVSLVLAGTGELREWQETNDATVGRRWRGVSNEKRVGRWRAATRLVRPGTCCNGGSGPRA
jgi:hypothetical protein